MARPLKLTTTRRTRIVRAARLGAHREQAAQAAGIARSTLQKWIALGESDPATDPYRKLARELRQAEAEAELDALATIEQAAADGDWRARAWLLERRWPDRWGRRTRHEVSAPDGEPLELGDLSKLSDGDLERLGELLDRAHDG